MRLLQTQPTDPSSCSGPASSSSSGLPSKKRKPGMRLHIRRLVLACGLFAIVLLLVLLWAGGNLDLTGRRGRAWRLRSSVNSVLQFQPYGAVVPDPSRDSVNARAEAAGIQLRGQRRGTLEAEKRIRIDAARRKGNSLKAAVAEILPTGDGNSAPSNASLGHDGISDAAGLEHVGVQTKETKEKYNMNIWTSDKIPLDRAVPDSRPEGCAALKYRETLPSASVVITLYNEWPSVVLRTVCSIINRTPKRLLKEVILVDDASTTDLISKGLKKSVASRFPPRLVKLIHMKRRQGLIRSRLEGLRHVRGEVVVFLDSHMEVNKDWLQPLLTEIVKKRETIALAQLDYIDKETFKYNFYPGYQTRYGFRWDMQFFETYFRPDQKVGKKETDPMPGVLFVGTGFAVDVKYFRHIGSYDPGMTIWGGENIELAWRVWMCGGQILHVPCSHIGHVERQQPYEFPKGRLETEMYNYKRAVDVWLGDDKKYVYQQFPGMAAMDVDSLAERRVIQSRLKCHNFTWFIDNIWPELLRYKEDGERWGMIKSSDGNFCLDNDDFVFQGPHALSLKPCVYDLKLQGFALTKSGQLKTTIHCVIVQQQDADLLPFIENCFLRDPEKWLYTQKNQLVHAQSGLCLGFMAIDHQRVLLLQQCEKAVASQKWIFYSEHLL